MAVELITQLGNYLTTGAVSFIIVVLLQVLALLALGIVAYMYLFYWNVKVEIEEPFGSGTRIHTRLGRFFEKDGVQWLKIKGVKRAIEKPASEYIYQNKSLFWKLIVTLQKDGSDLGFHPVRRRGLPKEYVPVPTNVLTQYAREKEDTNVFYRPKPTFWERYGSLVLNGLTVMISGMVLIIVAMQVADAGKLVAQGMNALASALSSLNAPPVPA